MVCRRRSLTEGRETFQIASAEVAVLEANAGRLAAAEVGINKLDLQIVKLKQKEAKATARKPSRPGTAVSKGLKTSPVSVQES